MTTEDTLEGEDITNFGGIELSAPLLRRKIKQG